MSCSEGTRSTVVGVGLVCNPGERIQQSEERLAGAVW